MSRPAAVRAALALFGPPAGPCAFCGLPDRRYRLLEAVAENVRAGDEIATVAADYEVGVAAIEAAVALGRTTRRDFERAGPGDGAAGIDDERAAMEGER